MPKHTFFLNKNLILTYNVLSIFGNIVTCSKKKKIKEEKTCFLKGKKKQSKRKVKEAIIFSAHLNSVPARVTRSQHTSSLTKASLTQKDM